MSVRIQFLQTIFTALFLLLILSGCATNYIRTVKGELQVESKLSETIFLDPLAPENRVVFLEVRNTSGNKLLSSVKGNILEALTSVGYRTTQDPAEAQVLLQVNLLSLERVSIDGARSALDNGFGGVNSATTGTLAGGILGGTLIQGSNEEETAATVVGTLLGSLIGTALDANTQDVFYALVTDVQLSARQQEDVEYKGSQKLQQGSSGSELANYTKRSPWIRYRTRVVTTANKINLELSEAEQGMRTSLASTLSGLL